MKVIVTNQGFFDNSIKRVGEVFDYPLKKGGKLPSWVKKVEITKEEEAEKIKAEAAAKEEEEKAKKEAAEAEMLAEKYNTTKVKAEGLGIVIENEDRLTIFEALEVYEKAITDKEAKINAEIEAEKIKAEAAAKKNTGK